jgi:hypothetical protein
MGCNCSWITTSSYVISINVIHAEDPSSRRGCWVYMLVRITTPFLVS